MSREVGLEKLFQAALLTTMVTAWEIPEIPRVPEEEEGGGRDEGAEAGVSGRERQQACGQPVMGRPLFRPDLAIVVW